MTEAVPFHAVSAQPVASRPPALAVRRKCACGGTAGMSGECEECRRKRLGVQRKLAVGASNDPLEHEADRVADQVMSGTSAPSGGAPRRLQRFSPGSAGLAEAPASVTQTLSRPGQPLDRTLRRDMEGRFGHDFSAVRVHDDTEAARSARDIDAHAYTAGTHIVFGAGRYAPGSPAGRHLLAHELTHVMQQHCHPTTIQRQTDPKAQREGGSATVDAVLKLIDTASIMVPGAAQLKTTIELVRAAMFFWEHREEHMQRLLDSIGATLGTIPPLARAKLDEFLTAAGKGRDAAACVGNELVRLLESLAINWRGTLSSFVRDFFFVGLFERSIPTIIAQGQLLFHDILNGEYRSAIDRSVAIMTEVNAIAGVLYLWYALITTILGAAAGSEVPAAGNAVGAAAGLTLAQVVNIGLIASVVATEIARIGRGIDDMTRFWDDLVARERACREVAEGVFALTLTGALFYFGPQIQRFARSIISQASAEARAAISAATREASAAAKRITTPQPVTPEGFRFAPPEPTAPRTPTQRGPAPARPAQAPKTKPGPAPAPDPQPQAKAAPSRASTPSTGLDPLAEEPTRRVDLCRDALNLLPAVNDRWHRQRSPIGSDITVQSAAFRLDAGRAPPLGQPTNAGSRRWARGIGLPKDDAGHVIARRFGGTRLYNVDPGGNIFPQDLSVNRGRMVVRDGEAATLHNSGCDVCVRIELEYDSSAALRPNALVHSIMVRRPGAPDFVWLDPQRIPNP